MLLIRGSLRHGRASVAHLDSKFQAERHGEGPELEHLDDCVVEE